MKTDERRPALQFAVSVAVFVAALAVAALLSIDDVEGPRRGTTEVERGSSKE